MNEETVILTNSRRGAGLTHGDGETYDENRSFVFVRSSSVVRRWSFAGPRRLNGARF
jgi:hypothetical protein